MKTAPRFLARISTIAAVSAALGGALAHCQSFDRAEYARLTGRSDGGAEAAVDASRDGGGDGGPSTCAARTREVSPGCSLAIVPTLPPGLPNVIGDTKVFVLRRLSLGAGGAWMTIGHDRDGLCTSSTGNDGGAPSVACRSPLVLSDGQNGRDNAFGSVIGQVGVFGGAFNESDLNASIENGKATIGLRLRDFGGANDGAMTVEMLPLYGGHAMGSTTAAPRWDGSDTWGINRNLAYTSNGRTVRITSTDSFTSCGTVVMPFPNTAPLYFENDRIRSQLTLTDIRLVGQLDPRGNLTTADMSAIWSNTVIFDDLRTFGACRELLSANEWMTLLLGLSASLDITSTGAPNPAAECSAMSIGFRFELVPATLTGDVDPPPPAITDPCGAAQDAGARD